MRLCCFNTNKFQFMWNTNKCMYLIVKYTNNTKAENMDGANYIYWGKGGLSWAMPYVLGVYAMA